MSPFALLLDPYDRRARLTPSVLVVLPLGLAVAVWFPEGAQMWGIPVALGGTFGLGVLAAQFARDAGRAKQGALYGQWGGQPSTYLLSHRTSTLNAHTLTRYHTKLRSLQPTLLIPANLEEEQDNSEAADAAYGSCSDFLREATRDKAKFPLVFEENVNYGFRRNLWAMRTSGIVATLAGGGGCLYRIVSYWEESGELHIFAVVSIGFCAVFLLIWLFMINSEWVRKAAESYAERLLAACELL